MSMYFVLAWRNVWRNRNRTLITTASIFFAVILVLFMRSMQLGTYAHIGNTLRLSTGYMQVQARGFWEKRSVDNTFVSGDSLQSSIASVQHVTMTVPRFEGYALASSGMQSRGVSVQGIDPDLENRMSGLSRHVKKGAYLTGESNGLLIGSKLAGILSISVGDTLVLIGQGFHGMSATGSYPICWHRRPACTRADSRAVFMPLRAAQELFAAENRFTALAVTIDEPQNMQAVKEHIARSLPAGPWLSWTGRR